MKRVTFAVVLALLTTGVAACGGGSTSSSGGGETRTVLVDYRHDETELSIFDYFPKKVSVRPGDTVEFKQAWTGEPHSVTFGTIIDPTLTPIIELLQKIEETGEIPREEPKEFEAFDAPFALDEDDGVTFAAQNAAQPCYLDDAAEWPGDKATPCPQRERPDFTGRDAIYSSGLIPYEGVGGNTFDVPIAADATPGTYGFFCNVHGPLQYGQVEILPKGSEIPSAREVAKAARDEAEARTKGMVANHAAAKKGKPVTGGDPESESTIETKGKRLIGVPSKFVEGGKIVHGVINEFVPKQDRARVGEKVTWTFAGNHTISFNVPKYFPVFTIEKDGAVEFNEKVGQPAGWPGPPEEPEDDGPPEGEGPPEEEEPVQVDAGAWDGKGFRSTGLDYRDGAEFSVTFAKSGTYPFACLIHPSMVGTIVVR